LAASLVTSQAQVFSQNVVGYINITLKPGYNLIGNQLVNGTNGIAQIFPSVPDNSILFKWNFAGQTFSQADTYYAGAGVWSPDGNNVSTTQFNPGEGFFFQNTSGADLTVTLTGQVTTGNNLNVSIQGPGYGFYSSIVPDGSAFDANGFPAVDGMTYQTFNTVGGSYSQALTYYAGAPGWSPDGNTLVSAPAPAVGTGFLINNPGSSTTWTRNFNP
jgi:hypothetical protein